MAGIWSIWHNRAVGILLLMCVVMGYSCRRTQPQRPTFYGQQSEDTTAVGLLMMNQQMASEADLQLANRADSGYVLMEENYWVKGLHTQDSNVVRVGEYVSLKAAFYTMEDSLITKHEAEAPVGKIEEIQAIVYVMDKLHRGDSITMLVPWYMAFGSAGNQQVLPYENVRVELTIR